MASSVCMIGQQLCGVNVLAFYSTVFFQDINGHTTRNIDALWLSWGIGLANFVFTFPAYWGIDKLGRRYLLLVTYPGMIVCLLGASLSFLGGTDGERNLRVGIFIFGFILFYSVGQGPAFAYSSEVFPLFNREAGMSWAVFINLFFAGFLTLFVPQALVTNTTYTSTRLKPVTSEQREIAKHDWLIRQAKPLGVFTGLCTLSLVLIYFFVPETKLATKSKVEKKKITYISLEELNPIFNVRTRDFWRYQTSHIIPYVHNTILWHLMLKRQTPAQDRDKMKPKLEVMYYWAEVKQNEDANENEGGEEETTVHLGSPTSSPRAPHGSIGSCQHQHRSQQPQVTPIPSATRALHPSPRLSKSIQGSFLQPVVDSTHRRGSEANSNQDSQTTRVDQQHSAPLNVPRDRQSQQLELDSTDRLDENHGERSSESRPQISNFPPRLQLADTGLLDLLLPTVRSAHDDAGSNARRQTQASWEALPPM